MSTTGRAEDLRGWDLEGSSADMDGHVFDGFGEGVGYIWHFCFFVFFLFDGWSWLEPPKKTSLLDVEVG